MAELKQIASKGKLSWGGYWATEESYSFQGYIYYTAGGGGAGHFGKRLNGSWTKVVCVSDGNE